MRTAKFPKPKKRGPKPRKPIKRGRRPQAKAADRHGDYRQRVKYAAGLWSEIIRLKEPSGVCPRCRSRKWTDACHGLPKGYYPRLRFELTNGIPLCRVCHRRVDADAVAKEHLWSHYEGWEAWERLKLLAQARGSKLDMFLVILYLEKELDDARKAGIYRRADREGVVRVSG